MKDDQKIGNLIFHPAFFSRLRKFTDIQKDIEKFLAEGNDINSLSDKGLTLLDIAISCDNRDAIMFLKENGAIKNRDPQDNKITPRPSIAKRTPTTPQTTEHQNNPATLLNSDENGWGCAIQ